MDLRDGTDAETNNQTERRMSTPHDGGNAFPNSYECEDGELITHHGMTMRDYLAAHEKLTEYDDRQTEVPMPLAEALAGPRPKQAWNDDPVAWIKWEAKWRATMKYIRADAMLEVREAGAVASIEVERLKEELWEAKGNYCQEVATNDAMRKQCVDELIRRQKAEEQAARLKAALDKILHHHSATVFNEAMDLRRIAQEALAAQARE